MSLPSPFRRRDPWWEVDGPAARRARRRSRTRGALAFVTALAAVGAAAFAWAIQLGIASSLGIHASLAVH